MDKGPHGPPIKILVRHSQPIPPITWIKYHQAPMERLTHKGYMGHRIGYL